jgi:hypothetical protein
LSDLPHLRLGAFPHPDPVQKKWEAKEGERHLASHLWLRCQMRCSRRTPDQTRPLFASDEFTQSGSRATLALEAFSFLLPARGKGVHRLRLSRQFDTFLSAGKMFVSILPIGSRIISLC